MSVQNFSFLACLEVSEKFLGGGVGSKVLSSLTLTLVTGALS